MRRVLAITLYDRTPEVIRAVCAALSFPSNRPDVVAVCYDRAPQESVDTLREECKKLGAELREAFLTDDAVGPRCPSMAWNKALALTDESHVFCMSSEMVLAPHSIGMAYHLAEVAPSILLIGRAEHVGQSYVWAHTIGKVRINSRTITCAVSPSPLGFCWLLPMEIYRQVGGFDESYQDGFCYEDDDLVLNLWNAGADFVFCDDVMGFHLEHKRDHLRDEDGRVTINGRIFEKKWGDLKLLKDRKFEKVVALCEVGLSFWMHTESPKMIREIFVQQKLYGQDAPWRAIPVEFK